MAKGKYQEWIEPDGLLRIEAYARNGLTDEQIAKNIGINVATLYDWKNKYNEISNALKKGKEVVDIAMENALYKKGIGYTTTVKKAFKVKMAVYDEDTGRKLSEREEIVLVDEEVYIPPDTTAQIFWLKNRKPAEWRDKHDMEVDVKSLPQIILRPSGADDE